MHEFRLAINVTEVPDVIITTHLQYLEVRSKDTKWCKGEPSRTCTQSPDASIRIIWQGVQRACMVLSRRSGFNEPGINTTD